MCSVTRRQTWIEHRITRVSKPAVNRKVCVAHDRAAAPSSYCNATRSNATFAETPCHNLPSHKSRCTKTYLFWPQPPYTFTWPCRLCAQPHVRLVIEIYWKRLVPESKNGRARKLVSNYLSELQLLDLGLLGYLPALGPVKEKSVCSKKIFGVVADRGERTQRGIGMLSRNTQQEFSCSHEAKRSIPI